MNSTTTYYLQTASRSMLEPMVIALNKSMAVIVNGLSLLDRKLSERASNNYQAAADLQRLAETYDSTQPSYAADLRAAAMSASRSE
jgi:hypothetical protein